MELQNKKIAESNPVEKSKHLETHLETPDSVVEAVDKESAEALNLTYSAVENRSGLLPEEIAVLRAESKIESGIQILNEQIAAEAARVKKQLTELTNPTLGKTVGQITAEKRDDLAAKIHTIRSERDLEIGKTKTLPYKLQKLLGVHDRQPLNNAQTLDQKADSTLRYGKGNIEKEKEELIEQTIRDTIIIPLNKLHSAREEINGQWVDADSEYYKQQFALLDQENFDIAFGSNKYRYKILEAMRSYIRSGDSSTPKREEVLTLFADTLLKHKDELKPENYQQRNGDDANITLEQSRVLSVIDRMSELTYLTGERNQMKRFDSIILNNINDKIIRRILSPQFSSTHEVILAHPESDAYKVFNAALQETITSKNIYAIEDFLSTDVEEVRKKLFDCLESYSREKYNVSFSELSKNWKLKAEMRTSNDLSANFAAMDILEEQNRGSVKKLFETYGIEEFRRYPPEILLTQLQEEDIQQPYGVIFYPHADHNTAFDQNYNVLQKLFKDTRGHFGLKVFEVDNKRDIARNFLSMNKKYGGSHKISFMFVGGHGEPDSIQFGQANFKSGDSGELYSADFEGKGVKRVGEFFENNPTIVLISCSTGKEGGIGQRISKEYNAQVIAPETPTNAKDISVTYDPNGKPVFSVQYLNNSEKTYFAGKSG